MSREDLQDATLNALLAEAVRPVAVDSATVGRIVAGISGDRVHETTVRPSGKLIAWAGAAMAIFLVAGFALGLAIPMADGDDDALGALMFGTGVTASLGDGGIL